MARARCSTSRGVSARWLTAAALAGLMLAAGRADARTETIRWTHSAPARVTGFRIYLGPGAATFPSSLNVGLPTPSGGVYSATVTLGDAELAYAVVSALGSGGEESAYSNVRTLTPPAVEPDPTPDPDPDPGPAPVDAPEPTDSQADAHPQNDEARAPQVGCGTHPARRSALGWACAVGLLLAWRRARISHRRLSLR